MFALILKVFGFVPFKCRFAYKSNIAYIWLNSHTFSIRFRDLDRINTSIAENINIPHGVMAGTGKSLEKTYS